MNNGESVLSNTLPLEANCDISEVINSEKLSNKSNNIHEIEDKTQLNIADKNIPKLCDDKYAYTKSERFTSEIFKIEIGKLPKFFKYGECKKLLTKKLKLKPHKINVVTNTNKAYVTFRNEEDKAEAFEKLKKYEHKGRKFDVRNAKPKADAMAGKKRSMECVDHEIQSKLKKLSNLSDCDESLINSLTPWFSKSYEQQLEEKFNEMSQKLVDLRKQLCSIDRLDKEIFRWLIQNKKKGNHCCPTKPILPSPITSGYRNKCGFSIGENILGEKEVGFRLGKYRDQTCAVASPSCLANVPDKMKDVVSCFADYIRQSKLKVYDRQSHTGHWRQLMLRLTRKNAVMAVISISKQELSNEQLDDEKQAISNHFKQHNVNIDTLLYRIATNESQSNVEAFPAIVFEGEGAIYEDLYDLKFRVSPDAFFQCNTLAAEVLYNSVKNMVLKKVVDETEFSKEEKTCKDLVLLDVCCGTGTIGLCLARHVRRIIGIDICKEAIEDAKINAKLNNIDNAEFICGKAEDVLPDLIDRLSATASQIIAVVDPPRCGLHQKVIKAIRQCSLIQELIYVSCSIDQARINFMDLCRPSSKRTLGLAFLPVLAQPIDMFPHTAHCELVLLLKRINESDLTAVLHQPDVVESSQVSNKHSQEDLLENTTTSLKNDQNFRNNFSSSTL